MPEKTKKFKMPHTFVILVSIIILAVIISWIIPSGQFARVKNAAGVNVVQPDQFKFVAKKWIHLWDIPSFIVKGFRQQASLIFMTMIVGGSFNVLMQTNAIQTFLGAVIQKFGKKESLFIPLLMLVCAFIATTQSVTLFIAFTPLIIMLVRKMGFDSLTGAAIPLMGGAIGFATGTLNAATTAVAQTIAELPMFSGIGYRFVCFFIFWIVSSILLVRYAKYIRENPEESAMYELDQAADKAEAQNAASMDTGKLTTRQYLCLLTLVGLLVLLCFGCVKWKWGIDNISIVFIYLASLRVSAAASVPARLPDIL